MTNVTTSGDVTESVPEQEPQVEAEATATEQETVEETATEQSTEETKEPEMTSMAELLEQEENEDGMRRIKPGQVLEGQVVQVTDDGVMVDVGYKTEGLVPPSQLTNRKDCSPSDIVEVGETIEVVVQKVNHSEGTVILSKIRADSAKAWEQLQEAFDNDSTLNATCIERVKGGLIVDLGIRGFIPASHVDVRNLRNLDHLVGELLQFKVLELDRRKRKVVLSRKKALQETLAEVRQEALQILEPGAIVAGRVARLTNFGAFVELGGVDGLIHVSELSWRRVKHPKEVLEVGQEVEVLVLDVNEAKERVSLSLKQKQADPWSTVEEKYPVGSIAGGIVTKLAPRYVFVELEEGLEGLVPIGEVAVKKIDAPSDVLEDRQDVQVKILECRPEQRRILLSIRQCSDEYVERQQRRHNRAPRETSDGEASFTIGSRLSDSFKNILSQTEGNDE